MTIAECAERWLIQIERNICLLENEFFMLNEEQLNYRITYTRLQYKGNHEPALCNKFRAPV